MAVIIYHNFTRTPKRRSKRAIELGWTSHAYKQNSTDVLLHFWKAFLLHTNWMFHCIIPSFRKFFFGRHAHSWTKYQKPKTVDKILSFFLLKREIQENEVCSLNMMFRLELFFENKRLSGSIQPKGKIAMERNGMILGKLIVQICFAIAGGNDVKCLHWHCESFLFYKYFREIWNELEWN